jgi:hypothetical protein
MAIEGSLDLFALPEILQMISAQRKTGILTVQGEHDIFALSFKDGQVVAADALNQTVEDGLGQVLASQGVVSPGDFAGVQAEHESGGKRLFDLLLERGLVDRGRLLEALRDQTYQLLLQLLRWDQGDFKFYAGDEVAYEEGFYAISVEELLIRSLADLGGDRHGGELPDLSLAYERVVGGARIRYLGEDGEAPGSDPSAVWLGSEEKRLVERLDGQTRAEEIARESGLGEYKVLLALHRLVRAGAARPAVAMAAVAQPAPAPAAATARPGASGPGVREGPIGSAAPLGPRRLEATPAPFQAPAMPAPRPRPPVRGSSPVAATSVMESWLRALVALGALALLVLAAPRPSSLLLPFPWQQEVREGFEHNQRAALYQQVDRAARGYFLLEGHYPDALHQLVHLGLLAPESLADGAGRPLAYSTDELSYELLPVEAGVSLSALGTREAITGDFLLDPEFLRLPDPSQQAPLVLLD